MEVGQGVSNLDTVFLLSPCLLSDQIMTWPQLIRLTSVPLLLSLYFLCTSSATFYVSRSIELNRTSIYDNPYIVNRLNTDPVFVVAEMVRNL